MSTPAACVKMFLPFVVVDGNLVPLTPRQYVQAQTNPRGLRRDMNRLMNSVLEEFHNSHFVSSSLSSSSTSQHQHPFVAHSSTSGRQRRLIISAGPSLAARHALIARRPEDVQHQGNEDAWREIHWVPTLPYNERLPSEGNARHHLNRTDELHHRGCDTCPLQRSTGSPQGRICARSSRLNPDDPPLLNTTTRCGVGTDTTSAAAVSGRPSQAEQDGGDGDNICSSIVTESTSNDSLCSPDSLISDIFNTTAAVVGFQLCKEQLD